MNIQRVFNKLKANIDIQFGKAKYSYAQFGEDIIIDALFSIGLQKSTISYLDIGANSPVVGSNTYSFYLKNVKVYVLNRMSNSTKRLLQKDRMILY